MSNQDFNPCGVGVDNGNYFGLPFTVEQAQLVIISTPWDVTVSYGAGTAYAPDAIIEASTQLDLYDPAATDMWKRGIATAEVDYSLLELSERLRGEAVRVIEHLEQGGSPDDESIKRRVKKVNDGSKQFNDSIYKQAKELLEAGKIVAIVGGDHSTPYGALCAVGEREESFGVLHIDAHRDLRVAYEGFEFSHASFIYNILRDVDSLDRVVQVGIRDFSDEEQEFAHGDERIISFDDHALSRAAFEGKSWAEQCRDIVATLPQRVYVSLDIDGLTMEHCPNTGTPVPGGLTFNQVCHLVEQITASGRTIIGFDVVEVCPHPTARIDAIVGARILYKLAGQALASNNRTK